MLWDELDETLFKIIQINDIRDPALVQIVEKLDITAELMIFVNGVVFYKPLIRVDGCRFSLFPKVALFRRVEQNETGQCSRGIWRVFFRFLVTPPVGVWIVVICRDRGIPLFQVVLVVVSAVQIAQDALDDRMRRIPAADVP